MFEDRPGLPGVISLITPSSWLTGPGFLGLRQLVREVADEIWVTDLGGDNRGARKEPNIFDIETPVAIVTIGRFGAGNVSMPATAWYRRVTGTREEKLEWLAGAQASTEGDWVELPRAWHVPLEPLVGSAAWPAFPALTDLFPWQQPGCKFGRTWPIAPGVQTLDERWERFVAASDPQVRLTHFVPSSSGRTIFTNVAGLKRLVDEPAGGSSQPVVRYGYRSFDRQWAFQDPRMAKTESPSLWASVSGDQIFLASRPTRQMGKGPGLTASTCVPDLHVFTGSYGGKDVIPLYRDIDRTPNADPKLLADVGSALGAGDPVAVDELLAYVYTVLAGSDYAERFANELTVPGPRVPLTAALATFAEVAELGRELLWLHTYGERFAEGRGPLLVPSIVVEGELTLPAKPSDIKYDAAKQSVKVGGGAVVGVTAEVWAFEVSGMQVVNKWLGYRTAKGAGRAASSSSPLDHIRPTEWPDEWTTELLELLSVLQRTIDRQTAGIELLDRILAGPLIDASDLPEPPSELRQPPTGSRGPTQAALEL